MPLRNTMNKHVIRGLITLLLGTLLFAVADPAADLAKGDIDVMRNAETFARVLDERSRRAVNAIGFVRSEIAQKGAERALFKQDLRRERLFEDHGIIIFAFRNDALIYWSHNAVSPLSALRAAAGGTEIYRFENGWYRLHYLTDGIEEYVAAIRLKNAYPYQNQYLDEGFAPGLDVRGIRDISTSPVRGGVKMRADHQYFYLLFDTDEKGKKHAPAVFVLFILIGGLFIFAGLVQLLVSADRVLRFPLAFPMLAALSIGLRALSLKSGWPGYVAEGEWFSPSLYASSLWFPSLADFIINAFIVLGLALSLRYFFRRRKSRIFPAPVSAGILFAALFAFSVWINHLMKGLVVNSNIPFDIHLITKLNIYSIAGLAGGAVLWLSFFLIADAALGKIRGLGIDRYYAALVLIVVTLIHTALSHYFGIRDMILVLWPAAVTGAMLYIRLFHDRKTPGLSQAVIIVGLFALVAAQNFLKYTQSRERYQRSALVGKLSLNDDPVAELLFSDLRENLVRDRNVRKVFEEQDLHTRQVLEGYIIQRYFTGYWSNYNIDIFPFSADSSVWGKLPPVKPVSFQEFLRRAAKDGEPVSTDPGLYYLYESRDLTSYMAIIPLHYNLAEKPDGFFVVLMKARPFGQQAGFPSLLVDGKTATSAEETERYATAKYVNGQLRSSSGDFVYRNNSAAFTRSDEFPFKLIKNGYEHLVSAADENTVIVISAPVRTWVDKATVFSYLCAFFGLILVLIYGFRRLASGRSLLEFNLNQKIQLLITLLILTSMVVFAWATRFYIEENYARKNSGVVKEKLQSVLRETADQLGEEEYLDYRTSDQVNRLFSQLSFYFYTDMHLYNPQGELIGSSSMRMFNEGLLSRQMNPEAFANLAYAGRTDFLHEERIGKMAYISAYTPFYNKKGELLGYLNLPYFGRQAELENEISAFLETVVNIFVLLFIVSIITGLLASQWITAPLRVVRENLAAIELGKANRILGYSGNDEIGLLIAEYNNKVAELEHKAELLARSERESAWREMAKQVAHEIKNPLTPMKLNIQHLQRTTSMGKEVDPGRIRELTESLIEQIDSLAEIAGAFSNFAKMPGTKQETVSLRKTLENTVALFSNFERVKITLTTEVEDPALVTADKDQLMRVFNNLIKNAVQAIPETRRGWVEVTLEKEGKGYRVTVSDNGTGIDPEAGERIFMPNFTTKSRGMGLGLAMAKNIAESSGGTIRFESTAGEGSRFFVWLPQA